MLNRIEAKLRKFSQSFFYFLLDSLGFLIFSLFVNLKIEGKENIPKKGRFILAANHQNFFDGFFVSFVFNPFKKISFVIAKRALKSPFYQLLAKLIGSVIIGNEIEEYQRAIKKLNKVLTHGGAVAIFPEGDVSNHSRPKKFKGGVAKLSLDSKTKVIPIFLSGTYKLRYIKYWLKRPQILIKIGKPFDLYNYAQFCGNNLDRMASLLREKIIEIAEPGEAEKDQTSNSQELRSALGLYGSSVIQTQEVDTVTTIS